MYICITFGRDVVLTKSVETHPKSSHFSTASNLF